MATILDHLEATRANYAAQLEELSVRPRPSYSVGDRSMNLEQYQKFLLDSLAEVNQRITEMSGPVEYATQAIP